MIQKKERIAWADICKGLLITLLMFSHLAWVSKSQYGVQNQLIDIIGKNACIWNCFFMSCFFIVSGVFSSFNKSAKDFLWHNFKSLIIPAWVSLSVFSLIDVRCFDYGSFLSQAFLFGGGLWFLTSLFLSKILLWLCIKGLKNKWVVLSLLLVLSFVGKWLDDSNLCPNYWYHRNFLNFALFLGLGYYLKDFVLKKQVGIVSSVAFVLSIAVLCIKGVSIPSVVAIFNESLLQHPLTIWLSITGSVACIHLCKLVNHVPVLEYLGRNSLIVYIYHMFFLSNSVNVLAVSLNEGSISGSFFMVFAIIAGTLVFCSGIAELMNSKYFRWMKGVF